MNIKEPYLFVEINDKSFIFLVIKYNEKFDFEILYSTKVESQGIKNGKISNINDSSRVLKDSINHIEKKIRFIFKSATIINTQSNFRCINISGYKKLSGAQVLNEDISYILNSIKEIIAHNNKKYSLIHLFNSSFTLDKNILDNIPFGLYGDFYNQNNTFFLLPKTDLQNIKLAFNNCHINIERVILKPFADGVYQLKKNYTETNIIFFININKDTIEVSIFNNKSFLSSEFFSFGSNIIMKDVTKLCSLSLDIVQNIFSNINFDLIDSRHDKNYLDKKYFKETSYRKISIAHLSNIISSRIEEIINITYNNNSRYKFFHKKKKSIYLSFEDFNINKNFKGKFKSYLINNDEVIFIKSTKDSYMNASIGSAEIIGKGWEKEAIPIIQTKKSLISRLFSILFN